MTEFSVTELQRKLKEAEEEISHYKRIAKRTGDLYLRETEELSKLICWRKEAEKVLRESEEKYRKLFNNAQVGLYRIRMSDGKFIEANEMLAKMSGYKNRAEILASGYVTADSYVDPADRKGLLSILKKYGEFNNLEARLYRKDKSIAWFRYSGRVYPEKGYLEGVVTDITEGTRLKEKLLQAQKMEAIGTLAGGVAHDLNNILSGLVSYPELLLLEMPEGSPLRKPIITIKNSGEKAAVIVQDLLTLARRGVPVADVVNLNMIISEQLKSPEFEKLSSFHPDVQLKCNLERELFNIRGSSAHLSKSIMNILVNAAEAMPDGGTISISTENRYLEKPINGYDHVECGEYATVAVSDTGMGIPEEDLKRIFEPFYTKKAMGRSGTGLGMAVVWGTVRDHNGYIDIQSTVENGTTLTLYFPITKRKICNYGSLALITDYMGNGEAVVVVDDVEEQREIATEILKKLGYSVTSVSSGEAAVDYLKTNSADLIVLDMIMEPGINGLETFKRIIQFHPNQKAIICSGYSETEDVKTTLKLGAGEYIKKPYTIERIGIAVRDTLRNR
jgi:two-component system, cell cycle sensor histidine kinase and response regulator CckA